MHELSQHACDERVVAGREHVQDRPLLERRSLEHLCDGELLERRGGEADAGTLGEDRVGGGAKEGGEGYVGGGRAGEVLKREEDPKEERRDGRGRGGRNVLEVVCDDCREERQRGAREGIEGR